MKPNWLNIQQGIAQELLETACEMPHQYNSKAAQEFIQHVSECLVESIKRGNPEITEAIVLQINCLKALHGIMINQMRWQDFMSKVQTILKIGVLFLL
jgi:hypothetical protein